MRRNESGEPAMRLPEAFRRARIRSDSGEDGLWGVSEETAVEIGFNGKAWTVMMATPCDIEDLAAGLAFSEDALTGPDAIDDIIVRTFPEGVAVDIITAPDGLNEAALRRRTLDGVTGCGLCGVESLAEAIRRPDRRPGARAPVTAAAVRQAMENLKSHQPLNRATRTVHAAAWCDLDGAIMLAREDVGRHNALDKLIGAMRHDGPWRAPGFIVMSSRCSFELVSRAARTHAALLATISAPTGYALDLARALDLPLVCRGPQGEVISFPDGGRDEG